MNVTYPLNEKKSKHFFLTGDWHIYELCWATLGVLVQMALRLPPERRSLIINGDFFDFLMFMAKGDGYKKWINNKDGLEYYFYPEYKREVDFGNKILDYLMTIFPEIIFIFGNHENRINDFLKIIDKKWLPMFDLAHDLKLDERRITTVAYNSWLDIGDASITHGMWHGSTAHTKHMKASHKSKLIAFSHIHHDEHRSEFSRGNTRQCYSIPAMCKLNPDYNKGRDNNWTNGFADLVIKPNGTPNFHIEHVWEGELALPCGEIIDGKKGKVIHEK